MATMPWSVETLNETVDAELAELPPDMRARLVRIAELIASVGLPNVREPHVRHIRGPLWEIRLKGKAGVARALYVTAREQRVVILRAFCQEDREDARGRDRRGLGEGQGTEAMTKMSELHRRWSKTAKYKHAYDALEEEFDLARTLIEARTVAGLSQAQLARRMKTSQSYIARLEGGKVRPSTSALERFAQATRTRLRIVFEPNAAG
jgi:ribosome-binding protein aMBF1 (putative translation factor)/phage-related protein